MTNLENNPHDLPPLCTSCGYDLTGLGDGPVCPECGAKALPDCAVLPLRPSRFVIAEVVAAPLFVATLVYSTWQFGFDWSNFLLILCIGGPGLFGLHTFLRQWQFSHIVANSEGLRWVRRGGPGDLVSWADLPALNFIPESGYLIVGPLFGSRKDMIEP